MIINWIIWWLIRTTTSKKSTYQMCIKGKVRKKREREREELFSLKQTPILTLWVEGMYWMAHKLYSKYILNWVNRSCCAVLLWDISWFPFVAKTHKTVWYLIIYIELYHILM
jgi:hypothetical protein